MANETNIEKLRDILSKIADLIRDSYENDDLVQVDSMRYQIPELYAIQFVITPAKKLVSYKLVDPELVFDDDSVNEDTVDYYRKVLSDLSDKIRTNDDRLTVDDILAKANLVYTFEEPNKEYGYDHTKYLGPILKIPDGVVTIGANAFNDDSYRFGKIIIPEGVLGIEAKAFNYLTSSFEVALPESLLYIDDDAFYECSGLTKIDIPNNIKLCYVGEQNFYEMVDSSVYDNGIYIGSKNNPYMIYIRPYQPTDSTSPTTIELHRNCKHIACRMPDNLEAISLSNGLISVCKDCFDSCDNLETYDDWSFEYVGSSDNSSLVVVGESSHGSDSGLSDACKIISRCIYKDISQIPNGITYIPTRSFYGDSVFSTIGSHVDIPNGVKVIGEAAFENIYNLNSISIPKSVEYISGNPFYGCKNITSVYVDPENETYCSNEGSLINKKTKEVLFTTKNGSIPADSSVISIGRGYFYHRIEKDYYIPDNIIYINADDNRYTLGATGSIRFSNNLVSVEDLSFYISPDSYQQFYEYNGVLYLGNEQNQYLVCVKFIDNSISSFYIHPSCKIICKDSLSLGSANLNSIYIPSGISYIGFGAFYYGSGPARPSIELLSIPLIDNQYMYLNNGWRMSESLFGYLFSDRHIFNNIESLIFINGGNGKVLNRIYGDSQNLGQLKTITLPSNLKIIGEYAFSNISITDITIPNGVTYIGYNAFSNTSIKRITIPEGVTHICSYAFNSCSTLSNISIPNSIKYIGHNVFYNDSSLTKYEYENVRYLGNDSNPYLVLFGQKAANKPIIIHNDCKIIYEEAFQNNSTYYEEFTIPDNVYYVCNRAFANTIIDSVIISKNMTRISDYMFARSNLKTITIPGNITYIGKCAFFDCNYLSNCTISEGVSYIGYKAFGNTPALQNFHIPSTVTYIECGIFGCPASGAATTYSPKTITIDPENTVYHTNGTCIIDTKNKKLVSASSGCVIPNDGSVTSIGNYAFSGVSWQNGNNPLEIPNGVTRIGKDAFSYSNIKKVSISDTVTYIGRRAFYESSLESVTLPRHLTSIEDSTFEDCQSLVSLNISGNFNFDSLEYIGDNAFAYCENLTNINIFNSAPIKYIKEGAFYSSGIKVISIPNGITVIPSSSFADIGYDPSIHIPSSVKIIAANAFSGSTINNNSIRITCDYANKEDIKADRGYVENVIRPIYYIASEIACLFIYTNYSSEEVPLSYFFGGGSGSGSGS